MTNPLSLTVLADSTVNQILAALPRVGGYFNVFHIVLFLIALLLWAHNSAWVEADIKKHHIPPGSWILLVFGTGALCMVSWLLIPMFWLGFGLFGALYGTAIMTYILFRNRRVAPAQTVLTLNHCQRMFRGGGRTAESDPHDKDRTRIKDASGKTPQWPSDPEEHAAYQAVQDLLFDAIWRRASDVRLDLLSNHPVKIIYKIDGVDRVRESLDAELGPMVFTWLKKIAGMDSDEKRRPQGGEFNATIGAGGDADKSVDVDVKTSGSTAGQRMLLKLHSEEAKFRIPDLGLTQTQLEAFEKLVAEPKGVIIISGTRGSGITSTLYAILRSHDAFMQNIHTLEITKSLTLENISQHEYDNQDGTVSFGKRFRSILRTEPDIAMAGDTPDTETAALAAASGRQGKKVYLGMSARDTFTALRRYLQGVNDHALAASSLLAISCQRLARVVCSDCRRAYKPDPKLLKKANLPTDDNQPFYRPPNPDEMETDKQGNPIPCSACQGAGYIGRTGIFELLILDDDLRSLIAKGTALPTIKVEARKKGLLYLQEISLRKVYEGHTSINEVLRVTRDVSASKSKSKAGTV